MDKVSIIQFFNERIPDMVAVKAELDHTAQLQSEIWNAALASQKEGGQAVGAARLVLDAQGGQADDLEVAPDAALDLRFARDEQPRAIGREAGELDVAKARIHRRRGQGIDAPTGDRARSVARRLTVAHATHRERLGRKVARLGRAQIPWRKHMERRDRLFELFRERTLSRLFAIGVFLGLLFLFRHLWALFIFFIAYVGVMCLYNVDTPKQFASKPFKFGREM